MQVFEQMCILTISFEEKRGALEVLKLDDPHLEKAWLTLETLLCYILNFVKLGRDDSLKQSSGVLIFLRM